MEKYTSELIKERGGRDDVIMVFRSMLTWPTFTLLLWLSIKSEAVTDVVFGLCIFDNVTNQVNFYLYCSILQTMH